MTNNQPDYAWDASVFVAWLVDEATAPLDDIAKVVSQIESNEAQLIVSVTAYSEILSIKHDADQLDQFRQFLKRSNIVVADTTIAIAEKAGQIRSRGMKVGRKIKTPDATYLAVAILHSADVLHSLDPDMLNLNGSPIVDGLKITKPQEFNG